MAARARRNTPTRLRITLRRGEAIRLRLAGHHLTEIAQQLGYRSRGAVSQDISRALAERVGEPAEQLRQLEILRMDQQLLRLDEMAAKVTKVRDRKHITVSNGKVIYVKDHDGTETPLIDDDPVLRATAVLNQLEGRRLDVMARRAKLVGLDAPVKLDVLTLSQIDQAIAELNRELAEMDSAADAGAAES